MVAILVLLTIIAFLTVDYLAQRKAAHVTLPEGAAAGSLARAVAASIDRETLLRMPAGIFCSQGHTWVEVEPAGTVRVGCGPLPLAALGGLDRLELASPSQQLRAGETLATLDRGGRKIRLRSPVDGTIESVNPYLAGDPSLVTGAPYGAGWLVRVKPQALAASLRDLYVAEEAREFMRAEIDRFREFVIGLSARRAVAVPTMADGGEPVAGLAALVDDAAWADLTDAFFGGETGHGRSHGEAEGDRR